MGKPMIPSPSSSGPPPLKPAPPSQMTMHYDVPESPRRKEQSAIYEEIEDDVSGVDLEEEKQCR